MRFYDDQLNGHFEFDTKTGEMVLRLGGNYSQFDRFQDRMEGSDLEYKKKKYNTPIDNDYYRYTDTDTSSDIDFEQYQGRSIYKNKDESEEDYQKRKERARLHFSISMRSNAKRKFRFFSYWEADVAAEWVPDPINPTKKDRWGNPVKNGSWKREWDNPEKVTVTKKTERDYRWSNKILRNGKVYF